MTLFDIIVLISGISWTIVAVLYAWLVFSDRRNRRRWKRLRTVARLETELGLR